MSKLNSVQKKYLKLVESKEVAKKLKKLLKKENKKKEIMDSKKVLKKFFKSISPEQNRLLINQDLVKITNVQTSCDENRTPFGYATPFANNEGCIIGWEIKLNKNKNKK